MSTPSRIPTISFPSTRAAVGTDETSEASSVESEAEARPYLPEAFGGTDGFDVGRGAVRSRRPLDLTGAINNPASVSSGATSAAQLALPHGRDLQSTTEAGRMALSQHLEQDLFGPQGPLKDLPDTEKESLRAAAQKWLPQGELFETFFGDQGFRSELAGRNFEVTFNPHLKTAFALIDK